MSLPTVSIVMATYNRAHTIKRAIDSVLQQDFSDWELIIVDDGSTDKTREILSAYADTRIHILHHNFNRGVCAAKNTGFDNMLGDWFTTLDSDDEMLPNALSTMLNISKEIDSSIDAVTCNCIDTSTGEFSGKGVNGDQWLNFETLVKKCSGEHWGLTKKCLLGNLRLNEKINGGENLLWYQVSKKAKRYYIHQALRIYHTEGNDRICQKVKKVDLPKRITFYLEISKERDYLDILKKYLTPEYLNIIFNIVLVHVMEGHHSLALKYFNECKESLTRMKRLGLWVVLKLGAVPTRVLVQLFLSVR